MIPLFGYLDIYNKNKDHIVFVLHLKEMDVKSYQIENYGVFVSLLYSEIT